MEGEILEITCDYVIETDCENDLCLKEELSMSEKKLENKNVFENDQNKVISQIQNIGNCIDNLISRDNTIYTPNVLVDVDPKIILNNNDLLDESTGLLTEYTNNDDDILLRSEIEKIKQISIDSTVETIAAYDNIKNIVFYIPIDLPISSRLRDYLWNTSCICENEPLRFESCDVFEEFLEKKYKTFSNDCIGFFGYHYWKNGKTFKLTPKDGKIGNKPEREKTLHGCFVFDDFSLIIMKNGKIIDYAIHGVENNVNEIIRKYKPIKIFYSGKSNDPISVFLKYKYQPFSEFSESFVPIQMYLKKYVVIQNCKRKSEYCSFCNANQFVLNYYDYEQKKMEEHRAHRDISIGEYSQITKYSNKFQHRNIEKKFHAKKNFKRRDNNFVHYRNNFKQYNKNPYYFNNRTTFNNFPHRQQYVPYHVEMNPSYINPCYNVQNQSFPNYPHFRNYSYNHQFFPNNFVKNNVSNKYCYNKVLT